MTQPIVEDDLRLPEFKGLPLDHLERRPDGKIVRKDRWQRAVESIRFLVGVDGREYEIPEVVEAVERLAVDVNGWNTPDNGKTFEPGEAPRPRKLVDVLLEDGTLLRGALYEPKDKTWWWLGVAVPLPVRAWKARRETPPAQTEA